MVNYTVDGASPILQYVGNGWNPILSSSDTEYAKYNNQTAIATREADDHVNLTFYGTSVWIYGAKRGNHGQYEVALDGGAPWIGNGTGVPDTFQTLLYGISNLTLGSHTLTLTNKPTDSDLTWVDIDYVIFADGRPDDTPTVFTDIQGTGFEYFPDISHWEHLHDNATFGGSIYRTQSDDGSIKLTFNGEAVALYGRIGSSNSQYICGVDNNNITGTSYSVLAADQQILCYANNLEKDVEHTLHVFNQPSGSKVWLELDYVRIWGENARSVWPRPHHSKLGMIAGVVGVALAIILLFIALFLFFTRRKQERKRGRKAAYARVTLDEGEEDWVLEPYRPESFHGDELGVYSAMISTPPAHPEVSQSSAPSSSSGHHDSATGSARDNTTGVPDDQANAGLLTTAQDDDARRIS